MKTLKKLSLLTFVMTLSLGAAHADCSLNGEPKVSWVAFKTMKKVGVGGSFDKATSEGNKSAKDIKALLANQKISIDTGSVNTKNPARDKKIVKHFFGALKESTKGLITGQIKKVSKDTLTIDIFMNGKKQTVPMKYSFDKGMVKADGHIDVLDFALSDGLAQINKACYALHEGKTWSHVEISFEQKVTCK
jgi:polyisoprenoid-binding protein YceI